MGRKAEPKKVTLTEGRHSKIGPSSSHRWMNCPASVALSDKMVKAGTASLAGEAAREGTAAHHVLANCLMTGKEPWDFAGQVVTVEGQDFIVDKDMVEGVALAVNFVRMLMDKNPGAILKVELALSSVLDEEAFGTGDVGIIVPGKKIIIADFKYGKGVTVEPDDSQLKLYGYMFWEMFGSDHFEGMESVPVEQWIMQPRIPHPRTELRDWSTTTQELTLWFMDEVLPAMAETRNPLASFKVGSWCHFCPARKKCPALQADTMNLDINRDPVALTPEEIGDLLERGTAIMKYLERIEEEALQRARQGDKIRGYKLVQKMANRAWKDQITVSEPDPCDPDAPPIEVVYTVEELLKEKFGKDAYSAPQLLGPAAIEKLPGGKSIVQRCAFKPDTGTTLAPESDRRVEVRPLISMLDQKLSLDEDFPV